MVAIACGAGALTLKEFAIAVGYEGDVKTLGKQVQRGIFEALHPGWEVITRKPKTLVQRKFTDP